MADFLSKYSMYILLALLLVAMMVFSSRNRRRMVEQQAQRERDMAEQMVPGAWVKTAVGFWGRFVDQDGDVIVLQTQDGTEMYWDRAMIREVGVEPPFAADEPEALDDDAADEPVLGLDSATSPVQTDDDKN